MATPQTETENTRRRAPKATHIMVRSRKPSFRRAGLAFTAAEWKPLELAALEPGVEKQLRAEPMLEVHDAEPGEIEAIERAAQHLSDPRSAPELFAELVSQGRRLTALEEEDAELRAKIRDGLTRKPEGAPRLPNG